MKKEYDFTGAERGKFYRRNVRLSLPIYLEADVAEFVHRLARKKNVDAQTAVNRILRTNKELLQSIQ
jgi:hypothetical protein